MTNTPRVHRTPAGIKALDERPQARDSCRHSAVVHFDFSTYEREDSRKCKVIAVYAGRKTDDTRDRWYNSTISDKHELHNLYLPLTEDEAK